MSLEIYEYREGGNNEVVHRLPGRLQYPNLILTRGLTHEDAVQRWFLATQTKAQPKEITLTLSSGTSQRIWTFADAYPVRWTGPVIDSNGGSIATETLEIAHSGLKLG
jgi:phage tail-like protein